MQHSNTAGCILLKFYIKPQHTANVYNLLYVVSYRNSTSNHNQIRGLRKEPVVVSYRNSTSNHNRIECTAKSAKVVSYRNSTSNHNTRSLLAICPTVVSYRNSTSNHNSKVTATVNIPVVSYRNSTSNHNNGTDKIVAGQVVSYRNSTSNHNASTPQTRSLLLYLIEILHQTTTSHLLSTAFICCILSKFYIKPQQRVRHKLGHSVVSYRNSTSNHNQPKYHFKWKTLYLIEILHQTTTKSGSKSKVKTLYLIEILHQTTTRAIEWVLRMCCILSKFYIKPQLYI